MKKEEKMQVIELKTMTKFELDEPTVVALGTFDGCHMAHRRVLSSAFYEAKGQGEDTNDGRPRKS